jgi:hypothetical protein
MTAAYPSFSMPAPAGLSLSKLSRPANHSQETTGLMKPSRFSEVRTMNEKQP